MIDLSVLPGKKTNQQLNQLIPAKATYLNGHSSTKRNLYFITYSTGDRDFVHPVLAVEFNLINLYYDLHNCHRVKNGTQKIMAQLKNIIQDDANAVVLGHSFNGYIAYQLACILPQISHCIMIDSFNTFLPEQYEGKNRLLMLSINLYRQVIRNGDLGYPLSLLRHFFRNSTAPKKDYDDQVRTGAHTFFREVTRQPALNNLLFVKASRSCMSNPQHGPNWEPYVSGGFDLISFPADHLEIKKFDAEIADYIVKSTQYTH